MPVEAKETRKLSVASLISGILVDAKDLFAHQLELAKDDMRQDIRKTKTAAGALGVALGILGIAVTMLLLAVVHWSGAATDWPLWQCYGLVGVLISVVGTGVLGFAKKKAAEVDFVPEKTAQAVKEDVGWIKAHIMPNKIASTRERR